MPTGLCAAASALAAGTLVDLEHIPLSRLRHGDWSMLRTLVTGLPISLQDHEMVTKGGFDAH